MSKREGIAETKNGKGRGFKQKIQGMALSPEIDAHRGEAASSDHIRNPRSDADGCAIIEHEKIFHFLRVTVAKHRNCLWAFATALLRRFWKDSSLLGDLRKIISMRLDAGKRSSRPLTKK
ncbi:hypothetical protein [Beijerinckia mobilis]|uniref:hypothetical protein n=1 Tax=Beijerinckia mobilis TaxID=231434 RepID=UPI001AEBE08C|nr:hypothetical protein [Beijerinckia mobilis]